MTASMGVELSEPGTHERVGLLEAAADPVRWAVLDVLSQGSRCVCELQELVPVAGNLMSYHLKVLRESGLVTTTRRGRWVDYAVRADTFDRLVAALPGGGSRDGP
ncbi:ArsR/SmtB family transcription factor [Demequina sp. SO4-18]|uniref:ArsR/SmtB family transcription factor n=1 Tax=Demequina sp. SO4-18 TaxID=3401026 RepID=UPI003B5B06A4